MKAKDETYVTAQDVAAHFRVSAKTILRRIQQGMPHYVLGDRSVRFKLGEVIEWTRDRKNAMGTKGRSRDGR